MIAGDEFGYAGAPDATKWNVATGPGHAGLGNRRPEAWTVADGVATVRGDATGATGAMAARFGAQKYGRWETRMKTTTRDAHYRPLVLLWPSNNTSPNCAEVDYATGTAKGTGVDFLLHYACGGATGPSAAAAPVDTTQWHNYAVEWTASGITGYVDGVRTFNDPDPGHQPAVDMRQMMQLDWFPDAGTSGPSQMNVDWVRVYN